MNNEKNQFGVKDAINCYRNINGILYTAWSDDESVNLEEEKLKYPEYKFIRRKIDKSFYRIYRSKEFKIKLK